MTSNSGYFSSKSFLESNDVEYKFIIFCNFLCYTYSLITLAKDKLKEKLPSPNNNILELLLGKFFK